jgi:arylsulfatase
MFVVVGAAVGFVVMFGAAGVVGRIYTTKYWHLSEEPRYVLGLLARYGVVGVIAATGPAVYATTPSVATLAVAALTVTVPLILTVGQKWRRLLGSLVYQWTDLDSGPRLKEVFLSRILALVPGSQSQSGDDESDGAAVDDEPDDVESDPPEETGGDDAGGPSPVARVANAAVSNIEKIIGATAAVCIGTLLAVPYLYLLATNASLVAYGAWAGLGLFLGAINTTTQSYRAPGQAPDHDGRKNVVLLFVDDLRRDRLSLYGYDRNTTPFLDSFDDAVVFENAVAPGTSSGHSIPAMLSGTFSTVHEYGHNLDVWYLPDAFEEAGYATACISGNPHITDDLFGDRFDWFLYVERGKQYLFEVRRALTWLRAWFDRLYIPVNYYILDAAFMNQLAKGFVDDNRDRPFFLYLHYQDIHEPYLREREHLDAFAEEHGDTITYGDWMGNRDDIRAKWYEPTVKNWGYDEKTQDTDAQIRDVVEFLEDRGLLDETVIAVASDHGELLGERGMWGHPDLPYNTLFEVPLVVYDPDHDGGRVDTPVSGVELPNVLLDLAGVEPGESVRDQWVIERDVEALLDDTVDPEYSLVDYFHNSINPKGNDYPLDYADVDYHRLLLDTEWKLYEVNGDRHVFRYDDTFLDSPVPRDEVPDYVLEDMSGRLDALGHLLQSRSRAEQVADPYEEVDDQRVRQQLEDLGYM